MSSYALGPQKFAVIAFFRWFVRSSPEIPQSWSVKSLNFARFWRKRVTFNAPLASSSPGPTL